MRRRQIVALPLLGASVVFLPTCGSGGVARSHSARAGTVDFRLTEVTGGLEHPWALAFLPDGRMLVTERDGRLRLVEDGRLIERAVDGIPAVVASGQGGLLVRAEPERSDELVASTSAEPMVMRGRELRGWLRVAAEDAATDEELGRWVEIGVGYAGSLPPKRR